MASDTYFKVQLTEHDLKFIGKQIGSLLLTAEVIKDLENDNHSSEVFFKDDVMYQWKRSEGANKQTASSGATPGKIEFKINAQNGDVNRYVHYTYLCF